MIGKDQCLRFEETLRREIKAWKDQFLRVDAEHTRLPNQFICCTTIFTCTLAKPSLTILLPP